MERIAHALKSCEWLVLIQTPASLSSPAVRFEVDAAINLEWQKRIKGVIPIVAASCNSDEIPVTWAILHHYDATKNYQSALQGLLKAIGISSTEKEHTEPTINNSPSSEIPNIWYKSPEEILAEVEKYWASPDQTIDEAILQELVPQALKTVRPLNPKDRRYSAVRMHIAKFIAVTMSSENISFVDMVNRLKNVPYWKDLCRSIEYDKELPHVQWVQTQAPLFAGGNILFPWSGNKHRFALVPVIARATSLGVIWNYTCTDLLTSLVPQRQFEAFTFFCKTVEAGNSIKDADANMRKSFKKGD